MRVLVTGSAGFAGRRFCRVLRQRGHSVRGIDIAGPEHERGDVLDPSAAQMTCRNGEYDLVVHCAAVVGGRELIEGAPLALAANLAIDASLFQWAACARPGRVIYLSSSAAYPVARQGWGTDRRLAEADLDLAAPLLPDELYGWAKVTGEMLAARARASGVPVTVVRPFSGYGEDQDDSYPFAAFAGRARRREDPFTIWGSGEQVRDFIHMADVVDAALLLAAGEVDGPVNLGTGRAVSMLELARMMCREAGYAPEFTTLAAAPQGVAWRVADPRLMLSYYTPRVALESGVRLALR